MKKATMTLNLTPEEMAELHALADRKGMSKTAVVKQALRLYVLVDKRMEQGERLFTATTKGKDKCQLLPI